MGRYARSIGAPEDPRARDRDARRLSSCRPPSLDQDGYGDVFCSRGMRLSGGRGVSEPEADDPRKPRNAIPRESTPLGSETSTFGSACFPRHAMQTTVATIGNAKRIAEAACALAFSLQNRSCRVDRLAGLRITLRHLHRCPHVPLMAISYIARLDWRLSRIWSLGPDRMVRAFGR